MTATLEPPTGALELPTPAIDLPDAPRALGRAEQQARRLFDAVRHPRNQRQLGRFLCVGASGYVVNTVTFWIALHAVGLDYKLAFCVAFVCGCSNNFFWNRHWTFQAGHDHAGRQAVRFFLVSLIVAVFAYAIMILLVHTTGIWKVPADALAWILVMPISFLVQKLWSFKA